jgi:hypothetical protein
MAIVIKTDNPTHLLTLIKKAIDDKTIVTWSYDNDGDFTHTPDQWEFRAWLRPQININELRLGILKNKGEEMSYSLYGVYGRFIEMLLSHFDTKFTIASATANKTTPDNF